MDKKRSYNPIEEARNFFAGKGWKPFSFQEQAWRAYHQGRSGLVNAPTGSGKTYSLCLPLLSEYKNFIREKKKHRGIFAVWITPIRALTHEIKESAEEAALALGLEGKIRIRTGDTPQNERRKLFTGSTVLLITTPESLHLLLASKEYPQLFRHLSLIVADEWHELMGSKRAVQMELAISRLVNVSQNLKVWGISATIGNMDEAQKVLLGQHKALNSNAKLIKANIRKKIVVKPVIPGEIEVLPWAGHLGIRMLENVVELIHKSRSTLIFTNTRSQTEIWYQRILEKDPELAGQIAVHHGSLSTDTRAWVEQAIHDEKLKAVVCTSSLDLGVDFRPVETIIQIGSAKGVSRFIQRAGRSGHSPGETSTIYFVPTHSLELVESAAFREAVNSRFVEDRQPHVLSMDVLAQYLITLAVSTGFQEEMIYKEISKTYSYSELTPGEWKWILNFITRGGSSLENYDDYRKVIVEDDTYRVKDRRTAIRHRLSIGTIVGDTLMKIKYLKGSYIGTIEEWFISKLSPGDIFWFSGKSLELVRIKDMIVQVRRSKETKGKVPAWMGGRMPLSTNMSEMIRKKLSEVSSETYQPRKDRELKALRPLFDLQRELSVLPSEKQLLVEYYKTREGYHLLMFPFEGRYVHEGMASIIAYRMSKSDPSSYSIAMNDYGFELLSNREFDMEKLKDPAIFSAPGITSDINASVNFTEMARRRFRDIAVISGLVFRGYPGDRKLERHLQASSQLLYEVFRDYDPENLLLRQAYGEVLDFQLEEMRMRKAFNRIEKQEIVIKYPRKITPFSFPLMVDRLREQMSMEKLEKRIERMKVMAVNS